MCRGGTMIEAMQEAEILRLQAENAELRDLLRWCWNKFPIAVLSHSEVHRIDQVLFDHLPDAENMMTLSTHAPNDVDETPEHKHKPLGPCPHCGAVSVLITYELAE
jgi:hypothetical protein